MKHLALVALMCVGAVAGDWVMFADSKDTYIYSTTTGEIYIRHNNGGKNYEDVFVKMPRGMSPNELSKDSSASSPTLPKSPKNPIVENIDKDKIRDIQLDALKKSQDMLNQALE